MASVKRLVFSEILLNNKKGKYRFIKKKTLMEILQKKTFSVFFFPFFKNKTKMCCLLKLIKKTKMKKRSQYK